MRFDRETIYESVLDDDLFDQLPRLVADQLQARSCTLHWRDSGTTRVILGHSRYFTDEQLGLYASNFADDDLWALGGLQHPNKAWLCSELVSEGEYRSSAFYNDWIRAMGDDTYHCMGSVMSTPAGFGVIGLHRGRTQADFAPDHARQLGEIAPDLRRMFTVRLRLKQSESEARELGDIIATLCDAHLVIERSGRIALTNAAADEMLRTGRVLRAHGGRLCGPAEAVATIDALVARATAAAERTGGEGALRGPANALLPVSVVPLPGGEGSARALVSVRLPRPPAGEDAVVATLRRQYGLSAAEAAVALRLEEGRSLYEIAEARQASIGTVRNQAKAVMWKMDVNRQSQVVAIVSPLRR